MRDEPRAQTPDPSERRQHPRYLVALHSALVLDDQPREAQTRDIGRGGICLVIGPAVPRGEVVILRLSLALGSGPLSEALELPARVVWCTELGDEHQLGLAFDELSYHQIGELEVFLRFLHSEGGEPPLSSEAAFDTSEQEPAAGEPESGRSDDA